LIRGDIRTAEKWGTYATAFGETNRLIAHIDQVILLALMDHPQARAMSEFLGRHMEWLREQGVPHVQASAGIAIAQLLGAAPMLRALPQMETALSLLADQNIEI
jgi:hypothetical protein